MNSIIAAHTRLGGIGDLAVLIGKMGRGNGKKEIHKCVPMLRVLVTKTKQLSYRYYGC